MINLKDKIKDIMPMLIHFGLQKYFQAEKGNLLLEEIHNHLLFWFGWVLWHINLCRLFNAKSIFIHINSAILNNSVLA